MAAWKDGERAEASLVARDKSDTGNGEEGGDEEMAPSSKEAEVAAVQKAEATLTVRDKIAVGDCEEEEEDDDEKIDETKDDAIVVRKAETPLVAWGQIGTDEGRRSSSRKSRPSGRRDP